jgi:hypothetical protein
MTFPTDDQSNHDRTTDQRLSNFLRQYSPTPPPASPDLEDRLLAEIEAIAPTVSLAKPSTQRRRYRPWLLAGGAIAAGLIASIASYRILMPVQPSATEVTNLEAFIETNWNGTLDNSTSTEDNIFLVNDSATD